MAKKGRWTRSVLVCGLGIGLTGCQPAKARLQQWLQDRPWARFIGGAPSGPAIAKAGDIVIRPSDIQQYLKAHPPARSLLKTPDDRKKLLGKVIDSRILHAEIEKVGLKEDPDYLFLVERTLSQLYLRRYLVPPTADAKEEQLRQYYEEHKNDPAYIQRQARHIVFKSRQEAKRAKALLKNKTPFDALAKKMSTKQTAVSQPAVLTVSEVLQYGPDVMTVFLKLKPGEISDVVKSPAGYHLIQMGESESLPFESAKSVMMRPFEEDLLEKWLAGKRTALPIQVDEQALNRFDSPTPK